MGMVVKQHILQVVDWNRFTLEEWLYQFGAWIKSVEGACGRSVNPIAIAMDQAVIKRKQTNVSQQQKGQIIADYVTGKIELPSKKKKKDIQCEINDTEARAVQKLVLDIRGQSEVMAEWMNAIIERYFYCNSWSEMEVKRIVDGKEKIIYSQMDARFDVKCGLAALHSKYVFINY